MVQTIGLASQLNGTVKNMSIDKDTKEQLVTPNSKDNETSESRRKFTKTGLAGSAVALSLFNRSALGSGTGNQCSMSILVSVAAGGSLDPRVDPHDCQGVGCTPGIWKQEDNAPSMSGWDAVGTQTHNGVTPTPSTLFSTVFGVDPNDFDPTITDNLTLVQAVDETGNNMNHLRGSIRAGTAAYLNVCLAVYLNSMPNLNPGLQFTYGGITDPQVIIDDFITAYNDLVNNGNSALLNSFESLYDGLNNSEFCPLAADFS